MKAITNLCLFIVILSCALGCFAANDPVLFQAISNANQKFMTFFQKGNANEIGSLYTEDAKLLPPGKE